MPRALDGLLNISIVILGYSMVLHIVLVSSSPKRFRRSRTFCYLIDGNDVHGQKSFNKIFEETPNTIRLLIRCSDEEMNCEKPRLRAKENK